MEGEHESGFFYGYNGKISIPRLFRVEKLANLYFSFRCLIAATLSN